MRRLNVYIGTALAGVLREEEDLWQFEYDAKWMTVPGGYDPAPGLPRALASHRRQHHAPRAVVFR